MALRCRFLLYVRRLDYFHRFVVEKRAIKFSEILSWLGLSPAIFYIPSGTTVEIIQLVVDSRTGEQRTLKRQVTSSVLPSIKAQLFLAEKFDTNFFLMTTEDLILKYVVSQARMDEIGYSTICHRAKEQDFSFCTEITINC
jgi:hypothetical protein